MGSSKSAFKAFLALLCLSRISAFQVCPKFASRRAFWGGIDQDTPRWQVSLNALGNGGKKKNLSAAERARREEEQRRRERSGDVVIGKTSARPGETDFDLDIAATEEEWMRQASTVEREVFRETERGMELLKMLRLEEASEAFDRVFELRPQAYLWQAGIAKFYQGEIEAAADIFARNAITFESKFGEPASEERIWRHACELKLLNSMSKKMRKMVDSTGGIESLLTPIPKKENDEELLRSEHRKVIRMTRDLFAASVDGDYSGIILSRAKLRSIGGAFDERPKIDIKMWKLNSWYYLGLHYDSIGEYEESKKCMKMALRLCPSAGNGSDIVHTLPTLHMSQRDWFDDDSDFESDLFSSVHASVKHTEPSGKRVQPSIVCLDQPDPLVAESIKTSIAKMKHVDLQKALKLRGIPASGSKEELQEKFFRSLMNDTGLAQ